MPLNLRGLISWDGTKIDRVAFRKWLMGGAAIIEPALITPGNIDKLLFDNLDSLVEKLINQVSTEDPLVVGDVAVSEAEVDTYAASFANISEETRAILKDNPHLVKRLQKFSREDQEMIVDPAVSDGVIRMDRGSCWLQEPDHEAEKPVLVLFTADCDPYAGIEKEALALAWLQMHPEWSDEQIAAKIGISRTSIYRFEKYKAARSLLKEGRQEYSEWRQSEGHRYKARRATMEE